MGRVLVACEFSGVVRDAFLRAGHFAMSVDLLPTRSKGPHHQGDVLPFLDKGWDLLIAHPPCTYLSNAGAHRLKTDLERWEKLIESAHFFRQFLEAPIPRIAVENPVMVKWGQLAIGRPKDQLINPYEFGHLEQKKTCLWLKNLPLLIPTSDLKEETMALPVSERQRMSNIGEQKNRAAMRSITYTGIAQAMADQWGPLLPPSNERNPYDQPE